MAGNSATPGYLTPDATPAPLVDAALENFLHDVFAGVTGIDGDLIRPAFQVEPPNQPARAADWLAFAVRDVQPDTYAATVHRPGDDEDLGSDELQRHETIQVLISAYGPNAMRNLALLRDGLQVEQNRDVLRANAMGVQETGEMIRVPSLAKDKWLDRWDMAFIFRRQVRRVYTVYSLASAHVHLVAETAAGTIEETINVEPPEGA
jgi:hypothetical protein